MTNESYPIILDFPYLPDRVDDRGLEASIMVPRHVIEEVGQNVDQSIKEQRHPEYERTSLFVTFLINRYRSDLEAFLDGLGASQYRSLNLSTCVLRGSLLSVISQLVQNQRRRLDLAFSRDYPPFAEAA